MIVEAPVSELSIGPRTQRIFARVPVRVSGEMNGGLLFQESTFTMAINADGALLPLPCSVRKGQRLRLLHGKTGQTEDCVVAYVEPNGQGYANVRVQFAEPHPEFWHIMFPPTNWTPRHCDSKFRREA